MLRKVAFALAHASLLTLFVGVGPTRAQVAPGLPSRAQITENVDDRVRVTLKNSTRPEARPENDRGKVDDSDRMEHLLLQLRRPPEQEQALQQYLDQQGNQQSPSFHRWTTPQQLGESFGVATQDLDKITDWLQAHGFEVNLVYPNRMIIDFSGTAGQVLEAFDTEIHNLDIHGEKHIANMSDPQIPAAFEPVVVGIVSLNDFRPKGLHVMRKAGTNYTFPALFGDTYAVVPSDLATIYNLNPLFAAGYSGQGQTIAVIEDTDPFSVADWSTFRSALGLSGYTAGSLSVVHPASSNGANNCAIPGVISPDDAEAILDAEWASAAAPSAAIVMAECANTATTFGGLIAMENIVNGNQLPSVMSLSYGQCETENGAPANAAYYSLYQQAAAEGISVFVAAGDSGAAGCDNQVSAATDGIGVNAFASTPYNTAVGGTDFSDTYSNTNSTYWSSSNSSNFGSALSYIPEMPWNDSCAGSLLSNYEGYAAPYGSNGFCNSSLGSYLLTTVAGGAGPSGCATGAPSNGASVSGTCQGWPKPSWQAISGNPNDGVRDTPDVSLFAADGLWSHYYVFCWSDVTNGGAACTGQPSGWSGAGGTSFASPIMAGIQVLVNQKQGTSQGNPNPVYYQLAANEFSSNGSSCYSSYGNAVGNACIFYNITKGDDDVNCTGSVDCYLPSGTNGVLSTSDHSYNPAFGTSAGWNFATGIGSVNAANLVNNWPSALNGSMLSITKSHSGNFTEGQQRATYTVTVSNGAAAAATSGTVTVAESLPSGLVLLSMAGVGWSCTGNICTRGDVLAGGASYPPITVTVNVLVSAISPQVNLVSVSGGGSPSASATDSTVIIPIPAVLNVTKTHSGIFEQGQQNAVYTVTVSNSATAGATSGSVTVTENVPSGMTLVSMAGTGWSCAANNCSRSDVLAGGASYPTITVTVNIALNANSPQVNKVSVSGGGSGTASAADSTPIAIFVPAAGNFVGFDTGTQGNWHGVYGADGYSIVNNSQSLPSYVSFAVQNQSNYTWASTTTDPRALQNGSNTGRIASTWYSGSSFYFDVNLLDGNPHQLAFYALDWDNQGRGEMIQILDANSGAVLDTRTVSQFSNGTYMIWNVSGHVKVVITLTAGLNAVISGVFFDGETVNIKPASVNLAAGQQQQFSTSVTDVSNQAVSWSIASVSPANAAAGTISAAGLYTAPANVTPAQVTVKATSADQTVSATAIVNLFVGAAAIFEGSDINTEGSWHGVYGADGYSIVNDSQSLPSYVSFAVQNQSDYTWASTTTDPRALQNGSNTGRIASTWYSGSSFSFDVNLLDGNPHQLAFYALDWDNQGRGEMIQILDANSGAVLDTRTVSQFSNGTYMIWNVSGHVKVVITLTDGLNAVISGVFFDGETVNTKPASVNLAAGQQQQFSASVTDVSNQAVSWSIASVSPANAAAGTISAAGLYTAPANVTPAQVTVKATSADQTVSATAIVNLTNGAVANFKGSDTNTEGSWHGVYGADGYSIVNDSQSLPSYVSFAVQNQSNYTWASPTTDLRALQNGSNTGSIASTWYSGSSFYFDVNLLDGNLHQLAFYALDWDNRGRGEMIQILDANSGAVLDTQTVSQFSNGTYVIWNVSGHVKVVITLTDGLNAVISGVFFDGESVNIKPASVNLAAGQQQQFSASVTNVSNQAMSWSIASVSPANAAAGTISAAGLYTAPANVTPAQVTVKATSADQTLSATAIVNLTNGALANFKGSDTSTEGSWHGVYGADGYSIVNDSQSLPSYVSFAVQNQSNFTWASTTTDPRALQNGSNTGRIASTWYSDSSFSFDVNLLDGNLHQLAFYALDWDNRGRGEMIQILDANSGAVLDTRTVSQFSNGTYVIWNVSGHVKVVITLTDGLNAVISGVFFK